MSDQPPNRAETPEERFERISKMPGVVVHRNPNPVPYVPDIRVREGITVEEIVGRNEDDAEEFGMSGGPPAWVKDAKTRREWMSTIPGVIIHHNPDPNPAPFVSDIWVNEGVTVDDILGYDDDDEDDEDDSSR